MAGTLGFLVTWKNVFASRGIKSVPFVLECFCHGRNMLLSFKVY